MRNKLAALILLSIGVLVAADNAPGWLKDLAGAQLPQYEAKVTSVVLFNEEHTTVSDNGKLSTTTRTAIKILARQGADVTFFDQYDTSSGKVRDFRAWMIAPGGKVKKYGKDEILDVACVANDIYNECRRRMVSGKRDGEAGAIFGYESVIEYQSFSNQLVFHFQDSSPVRQARFLVTVPPGWEVKSASFNGAPAEPAPQGGTYTWQMDNLAALEHEPAAPSFLSLAPWVGVNLLAPGGKRGTLSWPEAAKALTELNEGVYEPSPALAAKARALTEGAVTEFDKVAAIGKFTQQVNYASIQMNISKGGGYKPHPAQQTFDKLYGDCKDKANLTRAMLKAIGITAYPVAIYSGDRTHVPETWPSLGVFNHAISAIRVGPETKGPAVLEHPRLGRLLFFDPTDAYVPPGYIPDHEQASPALIAAGDTGDLVRVPASRPAAAAHERTVDATLTPAGGLNGRFTDWRTSEELGPAIARYRALSKSDFEKSIERWVGHSIPSSTTTGIEATAAPDKFTLKGEFTSPRFAQHPNNTMLILRAPALDHVDLRLTEKTRKYPLVVDTDALHETVRMQLPAGFKIDELPDYVKIDSEFGKYEARWKSADGGILFERTFEMPAQTIAPAQYAKFKIFLDRVAGAGESPIVLIR
jgi:hypothetical protein